MGREEFLEKVIFLYGDAWAYEVSKRVNLNLRTVQRMGSGKNKIPEAVAAIINFWMSAS